MSDDARQRLEAEAERLRQERERASAAATQERRDAELRAKADAASFSEGKLRHSVTRFTMPLVFCTFAGALVIGGVAMDGELQKPPPWTSWALAVCGALFGLVLVRFWVIGPMRYRRWLGALPFRLVGLTELLGSGKAVTKVQVTLVFQDTPAPLAVVQEFVFGKLPVTEERDRPSVVERGKTLLLVHQLSTEAANFPLHGWVRAVTENVLRDVNAAYRLDEARVEALDTGNFDHGSPD